MFTILSPNINITGYAQREPIIFMIFLKSLGKRLLFAEISTPLTVPMEPLNAIFTILSKAIRFFIELNISILTFFSLAREYSSAISTDESPQKCGATICFPLSIKYLILLNAHLLYTSI